MFTLMEILFVLSFWLPPAAEGVDVCCTAEPNWISLESATGGLDPNVETFMVSMHVEDYNVAGVQWRLDRNCEITELNEQFFLIYDDGRFFAVGFADFQWHPPGTYNIGRMECGRDEIGPHSRIGFDTRHDNYRPPSRIVTDCMAPAYPAMPVLCIDTVGEWVFCDRYSAECP